MFGGYRSRLMAAMITVGARNRTMSSVTGANRMPKALRPTRPAADGGSGHRWKRRRPSQVLAEPVRLSVPAIMPRVASSPLRERNSISASQINATCTIEITVEIALTTAV